MWIFEQTCYVAPKPIINDLVTHNPMVKGCLYKKEIIKI